MRIAEAANDFANVATATGEHGNVRLTGRVIAELLECS
jgi:hypothetical protein